jgi:hypothetical protein
MLTFLDLQDEVKRRAIRNEGNTTFDEAIKNLINQSLFRVSREAKWRSLRKTSYFMTKPSYTTGSGNGSYTNNSTAINISAANLLTNDVQINRRIKLSGDSTYHLIRSITGEEDLTIEKAYSGEATTSGTYEILGQAEYNLPIQASHRMFLWHEQYGYPLMLHFMTDQDFYRSSYSNVDQAVPEYYRMWGEDMVQSQPKQPGLVSLSSSASGDTSVTITVFGTVSGYPDYESILTDSSDGTTSVSGSKIFTSIDRIVKSASTQGRLTVTADSGNTTVAVLPVGDTTAGVLYRKVQLWPLPEDEFPINVWYYKDPYRLVNPTDVHDLGQDFDEAIIILAVAKLKAENEQKESQQWFAMYKDEIKNLRRTNVDKIDWIARFKRPYLAGNDLVRPNLSYRQVGPYYGRSSPI